MIRLGKAMQELAELRSIRPPDASFDDWERFLEDCREAGLAALLGPSEDSTRFANWLGLPLLKRWRWVQDAKRRGIDFRTAARAFDEMCERDAERMRKDAAAYEAAKQRVKEEKKQSRRRPRGSTLDGYQPEPDDDDPDLIMKYAEERLG